MGQALGHFEAGRCFIELGRFQQARDSLQTVLGLFSLAAVTIAVERAVNTRREKILPRAFAEGLRALAEGSHTGPDQFRPLVNLHPSPSATILRAGGVVLITTRDSYSASNGDKNQSALHDQSSISRVIQSSGRCFA